MKKTSKQPLTGKPGIRLLIIDDSPAIRQTLSRLDLLVPRVEVVGVAENGMEGLELLRKLRPDVATLDLHMPEMGGIELLNAIKAEGLSCLVIVLSGAVDESYRIECLALGADYVFNKTTEFNKFIEILRAASG
jgi:DNA-binding NarL/FixJ family response regulator